MPTPHRRTASDVTTYGLPERFFAFVGDLPGWWFLHSDAGAAREYLIRVEAAGQRFRASYYQPLQARGIGGGLGILGTFASVDGAHGAAVTAIGAHGVNWEAAVPVCEQAPASLFGGDGKGDKPAKARWM